MVFLKSSLVSLLFLLVCKPHVELQSLVEEPDSQPHPQKPTCCPFRKGGALAGAGGEATLRNPNLHYPPCPATQDTRAAGTFY